MDEISEDTIRTIFPEIQDIELMARGGQKTVFRGVHEEYGPVVIKLVQESENDKRIEREIEIAAENTIPDTPYFFKWGSVDHNGATFIFIIEELVGGETLRESLIAQGSLPVQNVLDLMETLLKIAVVLEGHGIVHRDIKPENIIVKEDSSYVLLDFGIARYITRTSITPTNAVIGPHTLGYAAPEQYRNLKKDIDIRADLFAIGVVAHECLSGTQPFATGARDALDIIRRSESVTPPLLNIADDRDSSLARFIETLMQKHPSRRSPSAADALEWFNEIPCVKQTSQAGEE